MSARDVKHGAKPAAEQVPISNDLAEMAEIPMFFLESIIMGECFFLVKNIVGIFTAIAPSGPPGSDNAAARRARNASLTPASTGFLTWWAEASNVEPRWNKQT